MIVVIKNMLINMDNVYTMTKSYYDWKTYPYNIEFRNIKTERILCSYASGKARDAVVNQILEGYKTGQKVLIIAEDKDSEINYVKN